MDASEGTNEETPLPGLAAPFAIAGAVAGWIGAGISRAPYLYYVTAERRFAASAAATVIGAIVGALLARAVRRANPMRTTRWSLPIRVLVLVVAAGALTGLATALTISFPDWVESAELGAACSLLFVPVAALVLRAAIRARRARLGSIVATADRRAIWVVLAIAVTLPSVAQFPAIADAPLGPIHSAMITVALLCAALVVAITALTRDASAFRDLHSVASASDLVAARDEGEESVARLDLGLGEDVRARIASGGSAYRSVDRVAFVVRGNVGAARRALVRALLRGVGATVAICALVGAHLWSMVTDAGLTAMMSGCARGDAERCAEAGDRFREASSALVAVEYFGEACDQGLDRACADAGELLASEAERADLDAGQIDRSFRWLEQGCRASDPASCASLVEVWRRHPDRPIDFGDAATTLRRACAKGELRACHDRLPTISSERTGSIPSFAHSPFDRALRDRY